MVILVMHVLIKLQLMCMVITNKFSLHIILKMSKISIL